MIGTGPFRTRTRVAHLAIAFSIALLLAGLATDLLRSPSLAMIFLPYFAEGLLFTSRFSWWGVVAGWAVYLALSIWLLRTADRSRYRLLFMLLCVLLIINIAGCHTIASRVNPGHSV